LVKEYTGDAKGTIPMFATVMASAMVARGADSAFPTTVRFSNSSPNPESISTHDRHHDGSSRRRELKLDADANSLVGVPEGFNVLDAGAPLVLLRRCCWCRLATVCIGERQADTVAAGDLFIVHLLRGTRMEQREKDITEDVRSTGR
jgi:hypothetical protein